MVRYLDCLVGCVAHISHRFHFRCIDLTPAAALNIDSYFCEICTEVGAGMTQRKCCISFHTAILSLLCSTAATRGGRDTCSSPTGWRHGFRDHLLWLLFSCLPQFVVAYLSRDHQTYEPRMHRASTAAAAKMLRAERSEEVARQLINLRPFHCRP